MFGERVAAPKVGVRRDAEMGFTQQQQRGRVGRRSSCFVRHIMDANYPQRRAGFNKGSCSEAHKGCPELAHRPSLSTARGAMATLPLSELIRKRGKLASMNAITTHYTRRPEPPGASLTSVDCMRDTKVFLDIG